MIGRGLLDRAAIALGLAAPRARPVPPWRTLGRPPVLVRGEPYARRPGVQDPCSVTRCAVRGPTMPAHSYGADE